MARSLNWKLSQWEQSKWIFGEVTNKVQPPFQLCEESDGGSSFYLFPDKFDFKFYNSFCYNLGGLMPLPITDENHHELMDVVSSLIRGCSQIFLSLEQTFFEKKVDFN